MNRIIWILALPIILVDCQQAGKPKARLNIVYTEPLRRVMSKFDLSENDMEVMLRKYENQGGNLTITKSITNDNGVKETVTLDFRGLKTEVAIDGRLANQPETTNTNRQQRSEDKIPNNHGAPPKSTDLIRLKEKESELLYIMLDLDKQYESLKDNFENGRLNSETYTERRHTNRVRYNEARLRLNDVQDVIRTMELFKPKARRKASREKIQQQSLSGQKQLLFNSVLDLGNGDAGTKSVISKLGQAERTTSVKSNSVAVKLKELNKLRHENRVLLSLVRSIRNGNLGEDIQNLVHNIANDNLNIPQPDIGNIKLPATFDNQSPETNNILLVNAGNKILQESRNIRLPDINKVSVRNRVPNREIDAIRDNDISTIRKTSVPRSDVHLSNAKKPFQELQHAFKKFINDHHDRNTQIRRNTLRLPRKELEARSNRILQSLGILNHPREHRVSRHRQADFGHSRPPDNVVTPRQRQIVLGNNRFREHIVVENPRQNQIIPRTMHFPESSIRGTRRQNPSNLPLRENVWQEYRRLEENKRRIFDLLNQDATI